MDPVSIIVSALANGAVASLKPAAALAISDAYASLKAIIRRRYGRVAIADLEHNPECAETRALAATGLAAAGAGDDKELLARSEALLRLLTMHDHAAASDNAAVDLTTVDAEYLRVARATSEGSVVRVRGSVFSRGIDVEDVRAGKKL
jgi:hypothetical protein